MWCFRGQQGLPMLECCFALATRINGLHGANMSCWVHWSAKSSTNAGAAAQEDLSVRHWHKIAPSPRVGAEIPGEATLVGI